jgi:hypothetical protein
MLEVCFSREQQPIRLPVRFVRECCTVALDALRQFFFCPERVFAFGFSPLIAR